MQRVFLTLVVFLCSFTLLPAATGKLETLQVGRYTRQGAGVVLVETGFLMAPKQGFVVNTSTTYPESSLAIHGMTSSVITSINGKALAYKATIDYYNQFNPGFLDNYKFSSKAYAAVGGDSYIVTLANGGGTTAPTVKVSATKSQLKEGPDTQSSFVLTLNKAPTEDIVVLFEFSGSVKGSDDFLSTHNLGSIKIKKGSKSGKVTITLRNDKLKESKEKLVFTILAHGGYKLGTPKSATITITDND